MSHFSRSASFAASFVGAPLVLAALLVCVTPAGAAVQVNALTANALTGNSLIANALAQTGVPANARITSGSALGDLNGVAVEAVIIPKAPVR